MLSQAHASATPTGVPPRHAAQLRNAAASSEAVPAATTTTPSPCPRPAARATVHVHRRGAAAIRS